jgi:hypothetical protein
MPAQRERGEIYLGETSQRPREGDSERGLKVRREQEKEGEIMKCLHYRCEKERGREGCRETGTATGNI